MNLDGVINYTIIFNVLIFLFIIFYAFTKFLKNNLGKSLSSFLSLLTCLLVFPINKIFEKINIIKFLGYSHYEYIYDLKYILIEHFFMKIKLLEQNYFEWYITVIYVISFLLIYQILKYIIYLILSLWGFNRKVKFKNPVNQIIVFGLNFIKITLVIFYFINIISLNFSNLYTKGYTSFIVNTPIINSKYDKYLVNVKNEQEKMKKINDFVDLYTSRRMITGIDDLTQQINQKESFFLTKVYPYLSEEEQKLINIHEDDLFLTIIQDDDLFKTLFENEKNNVFFSSIPIVRKWIYSESDLNKIEVYQFIKNNKEIIIWLDSKKTQGEKVQYLTEHYDKLKATKDFKNKHKVEDIYHYSKVYYYMRNYTISSNDHFSHIDVKEYELLDQEILLFLSDESNFNQMIETFHKDYEKGKFKKVSQNNKKQYKAAYEISEIYRKDSKSVNSVTMNPNRRMISTLFKNNYGLNEYLFNNITFDIFIKSQVYGSSYDLMDQIIYRDLMNHESNEIENDEIRDLMLKVHKTKPPISIDSYSEQFVKSNRYGYDESYIEQLHEEDILTYDTLKVLYGSGDYFTEVFLEKILNLIQ